MMTAAAVGLLVVGPNARADDNPYKVIRMGVPTVAAIDGAESHLMELAGPIGVTVTPGETYRSLIERTCPGASDSYMAYAEQSLGALNAGLPAELRLDAPVADDLSEVGIPYCVGRTTDVHVVQPGDSVWKIFQEQQERDFAVTDWEAFTALVEHYNGEKTSGTLQDGTALYVPKATVDIPVESSVAETLAEQLRMERAVDQIDLIDRPNWGTLEADAIKEACDSGLGSQQRAEELFAEVSRILAFNALLDDLYPTFKRSLVTPVIGVFDTGLMGGKSPIMKNGRKKLTPSMTDDDVNASPNYERAFHGAGVMSLALGGHLFARITPLMSLADAASYRVFDKPCLKCPIIAAPERLNTAMIEANKHRSDITVVNLSVGFAAETGNFDRFLGPDTQYLIVVAAGNGGKVLSNTQPSYPAMHGGEERSNIVTVAATDLEGALIPTSNRSSKYVDIAAWGCGVPVLEYDEAKADFRVQIRSGTSYAAPQVAFAAARLSAERSDSVAMSPIEIKKRIIASADINPAIWSSVRHGRTFNLIKTLSLYADVVELDDGTMLFGEVVLGDGTADEVNLCAGARIDRSGIRKIAKTGPIDGNPPYLIYEEDLSLADQASRGIEFKYCNEIFPPVGIRDPETKTVQELDANRIVDIVFASRPYWK